MANIVMLTIGTGGDLFPMVHIGRMLKARGHTVTVFTHCYYADTVSRAGLGWGALDTPAVFDAMKVDGALLHSPQHMVTFYRRHILPQILPQYEMAAKLCEGKDTILVAEHNTHLVSQMLAEKFHLPHFEVFIAPSLLLNDQVVIELHEILAPEVNTYRKTIGLPPVNNWKNWLHSADKKLAFWPEWFAKPDATWPSGTVPLGFFLNDEFEIGLLPNPVKAILGDLETILNEENAPVLITHGTSEPTDTSFFTVSAEACRKAGRQAILVTAHESFLPEHLPDNVHVFKFLPFANLMPRMSVIIHHGGIGTTARSLWAGVPQVVLAAGLDRPDNAERLQALGVAEHIPPSRWTADNVAGAIQRLTQSSETRERCQVMSEAVRTWQPPIALYDLIERSIPEQLSQTDTSSEKKNFLLVQNINYIPTQGGENKCNRELLEGLVARGHVCRAVVPALGVHGARTRSQFLEALTSRGIEPSESNAEVIIFTINGVQIHAVTETSNLRAYAIKQITAFDPSWALVSAGDPGQVLLEAALKELPGRVVYLAHTTSILPFGPASFFPSEARTNLLRRTAGIITTSKYIRDYIKRWANLDATAIHFPVYGEGPFSPLGQFDQGFVTIINPCSYKGISIFQALAQALPNVSFAAVPAWGTTAEDRANLENLPNVRLLPPFDNSDELFSQTRVLLAPSLWDEAFGISVIEAMLRGIPVITSNTGGLPEAKLGIDFVLPVNPIEHYENQLDGQMKPVPVIPEQDIHPWVQTLTLLLNDKQKYEEISASSREAALAFASQTSVEAFDTYFQQLELHKDEKSSVVSQLEAEPASQGKDLRSRAQNLSPKQLALLTRLAKEKSKARDAANHAQVSETPAKPSTPAAVSMRDEFPGDTFPVSFNQERFWFLNQFDPGSAAYNMPCHYRVRGSLEYSVLEKSLNGIIARHEVLRTIFTNIDGRPYQKVLPEIKISLPVVDLRAFSPEERETEALRQARAETERPFDLANGSLLRAVLLQLGEQDHILVLVVHHIVSDSWSLGIFIKELAALYQAYIDHQPSPLPALPIQYADFAIRQRNTTLQKENLDSQLDYWLKQLKDAPHVLDLPTDHPRPAVQTHAGAFRLARISPSLTSAIKALSRRYGTTLFMTLLAAFDVLLYRYSRQTDISVGTIISNRRQLETESLIGFLIDTLVLRSDLSGNPSFETLLRKVRDTALGAYAHQDLPFEKLVESLQPERNLSRSPLFQVIFTLQNAPSQTLELPSLTLSSWDCGVYAAQYDLTCSLEESEGGLNAFLGYRTDLFNANTIDWMFDHYQCLLEGIVANPETPIDQLPLLKDAERQQILIEWNATQTSYPQDQCIHQLFEAQVQRTPEAVALVSEDSQLTYRELNERANQLAHYLRSQSVGPDVLVGICMERSIEMVVGLLGILKAGGAYVPIDPNYPEERIAFMLQDAGVGLTLTAEKQFNFIKQNINLEKNKLVVRLDSDWSQIVDQPTTNPVVTLLPENLAYMIYTSGSTGQPKGALNTHAAIFNRLFWMQSAFPLTAADRILQKTPFSFDVSVWEFFWPLMFGARLVMARPEGHKDPQYLVETIRREEITTLHFVPSMLHAFLEAQSVSTCQSLRRVICSGEALSADLVNRFFTHLQAELHNLYGPTEAAVDVSWWACPADLHPERIPIGRPIANTQLYVLDKQLEMVPVGVAGELYIGGIGLARGYFNRPDLTAEKFVPNPFGHLTTVDSGAKTNQPPASALRLYHTGDLARYLPDGNIEYLGRIDHQVKIRGFRIELGEIEAALFAIPEVRDVVVLAREDTPGDKRLVAYLTGENLPEAAVLRNGLAKSLPEYMLPAYFIQIEQLPLTPNGKLDRQALPAPDTTRSVVGYVAPRTPTEETLVQIFADVLKRDQVGIHDNFFELGGHSLLATQVISRVRTAFQINLPLRVLFDTPCVEMLAIEVNKEIQELEDVEL